MENFFKLKENGTNVRREVVAGITTFLTMAYIIAVNPDILSATGMPVGPLVTATCLAAAFSTIFMGLYAKLPFALASGMGLNAFFAFSVVLGMGISWQVALAAVFIEGIIFIILSLTKVREAVVNTIPLNLKHAITVGIGLFIAFIGLVNSGVVVSYAPTMVKLGDITSPSVIITLIGIVAIVVLYKKNVKGALLIGIAVSTLIAWGYAYLNPETAAAYMIFTPDGVVRFEGIGEIFWKMDFSPLKSLATIGSFAFVVLTLLFVDFFDTVGTLVGVASKADMLDKDGRVPRAGKALLVDAVGTTVGATVGVSTVTTYIESASGVAEGGRTGLTSVVTGLLFLAAMFFAPLFMAVPSAATSPALIVVGFFMMGSVAKINFTDYTEGVPAFLTIIMMPFTYSIGDGLIFGILSYAVINFLVNITAKNKEDKKKVSPVIYALAIVFVLYLGYTALR
jgi:adenine/guanine/hypoxanthine permease